MRTTALLIAGWFFFSGTVASAEPADWIYYGGADLRKGEGPVAVFYLRGEVKQLPSGHFEVWTKGHSEKDLDAVDVINNKKLMDRITKKVAHYYVPPIGKIRDVNLDQAIAITTYEEIANDGELQAHMKILYEIDCLGERNRELSVTIFSEGKLISSEQAREWVRIPPESNGRYLMQLVCPMETPPAH